VKRAQSAALDRATRIIAQRTFLFITVRCTHGKACALRRPPRLLDKVTSHREEEDRLVTDDALLDPGENRGNELELDSPRVAVGREKEGSHPWCETNTSSGKRYWVDG